MEDIEFYDRIDDMITLLEDPKKLKGRKDVQEAVVKLEQLKGDDFIIITKSEVDVCTDALESVDEKADEFKQILVDTKQDIEEKQSGTEETFQETKQTEEALKKKNDIQSLKQMVNLLNDRITSIEGDNTVFRQDILAMKQLLLSVENKVFILEAAKERCVKRPRFVKEEQALQVGLVKLYQRHYVKTSISPLKCNDNGIDIGEVYIELRMEIRTKSITSQPIRTVRFI